MALFSKEARKSSGNAEIAEDLHEGREAPEECPACEHEQAYFEIQNENY